MLKFPPVPSKEAVNEALGIVAMTDRPPATTDSLTIRRVANGWIIAPGPGANEFTHVALTPADLAKHVAAWADAQIAP